MNRKWTVTAAVILSLFTGPISRAETDLPEEVRSDVRRLYTLGERFDRAHIDGTCAAEEQDAEDESEKSTFRCFRSAYKRAVKEKEPSVSGFVILLSIGTVVLAEERQRILESQMNDGEQERALHANALDTAELLIETLERVAAKSKVIAQEMPVAEKLRTTLRQRAEAILKQKPAASRALASTGSASTARLDRGRRDALLSRLSDLESE